MSNQIKPVLTGPDAKNVERVEVKTVLKEETPPGNEVSLTPADSVPVKVVHIFTIRSSENDKHVGRK